MSYLLIKVHSFACDYPGCSNETEHAEWYKADAAKLAASEGFQIGTYYIRCPTHYGMTIPSHNGS